MSGSANNDWNPGAYNRFRDLRLRPALDLIAAVGDVPQGAVVDLGCGAGAAGDALRARFGARICGVDLSPAMLSQAEQAGAYERLNQADMATWAPDAPPALIFSNAALHWVADHAQVMSRLALSLAEGGTLAVQIPHQNNAPSHRLWTSLMAEHFAGRVALEAGPRALEPAQYHHMLEPLGDLTLWETDYYQLLPRSDDGHPVRRFTESTFAKPLLDALDEAERAHLIQSYEAAAAKIYPADAQGRVLFPFKRLFFTLTV